MPPRIVTLIALAAMAVPAGALTGCNRGTVPSGKAFCDRVSARLAELRGPVADPAAARASVQAYRDLGAVAPAPVRDAWKAVTALVESAASLDLTSPEAQSTFAERALAAAPQVKTITDYAHDTCGVDLKPAG